MKIVTLCQNTGKTYKPREKGEYPAPIFKLMPGTAWRMDFSEAREHEVVEVTEKICKEAEYTFCIFNHDGRSLREFKHGDTTYAQPDTDDRRATSTGRRARGDGGDRIGRAVDQRPADAGPPPQRRGRTPQLAEADGEPDVAPRPRKVIKKRPTPTLL